jgi:ferredoxin-NADP reductase/Na+-translocating ferredoxin:NAD+ oxidoreductase RnfD subunit
MFKKIDYYLNRLTMYRVVIYCLIFFLAAALVLSLFKVFPFAPLDLLLSTLFILGVCFLTNIIFAKVFGAPSNEESVYITGLILALIISPDHSLSYLAFAFWASVLAMASKYILAIGKKHIFNPAALAVVITAFTINQSASWWIGNAYMAPIILIGGILIVRKIKRGDLVYSFFFSAILTILFFNYLKAGDPVKALQITFLSSPILFFSLVMLTEPMTTPPTKKLRIAYGLLTGFLFAPAIHLGSIYSTPELVLVVGNIFSYAVSPKFKLIMNLQNRNEVAAGTYDFVFKPDRKINYLPGQYIEATLAHEKPDNRGIRRFFTLASSPTEDDVRLGIKFYDNPSSFKENLLLAKAGTPVVAAQLAGDFYLPRNKKKKLVFFAGGIGVTPFRSMIKYLIDKGEKRDIVIFYGNKSFEDIAYQDIFDEAASKLGIKVIYALSDLQGTTDDWQGIRGRITKEAIEQNVPDYKERLFYLSGPHAMVEAYQNVLEELGVKKSRIKVDFFPGFA